MMREIKFRAWTDEGMINVTRITFAGDIVYVMSDNDEHDGYEFQVGVEKLRQFTGLKSKSGVEIYEGDIVETVYCFSKPHKGEVYFQPTRLNWSVKHSGFTNQDLFVYSRPDCSVEVIGNIYENPELLEK